MVETMYTKEKINNNLNYADISKWALDVYLTGIANNDTELDAVLSKLIMINEGPGFELSHKELTDIANILMFINNPIYTQQRFGKELKERIKQQQDVADIGNWSYSTYFQHRKEIDRSFRDFLIQLGTMEMGPEFERSYEELDQIADRLIAGEDVKL